MRSSSSSMWSEGKSFHAPARATVSAMALRLSCKTGLRTATILSPRLIARGFLVVSTSSTRRARAGMLRISMAVLIGEGSIANHRLVATGVFSESSPHILITGDVRKVSYGKGREWPLWGVEHRPTSALLLAASKFALRSSSSRQNIHASALLDGNQVL